MKRHNKSPSALPGTSPVHGGGKRDASAASSSPESGGSGPQSGSMGFGLPAALAAKAHDSGRFVLCFAGDGDFQMNGAELGTALQAGLHPVILILNNSSYGTIRMHQERAYPARISGTEIVNPDYVALAGAYGFYGERVIRTDDFVAAFERALDAPTGAIVEIVIDAEAIAPRTTISALREAAT